MEQIVLYLAVLAALAGFGMGLVNLAGPILKRLNISLTSLSLSSILSKGSKDEDDELELLLDDRADVSAARDFAEGSFTAPETSLLVEREHVAQPEAEDDDPDLTGILAEVSAQESEAAAENGASDDAPEPPALETAPSEDEKPDEGVEEQDPQPVELGDEMDLLGGFEPDAEHEADDREEKAGEDPMGEAENNTEAETQPETQADIQVVAAGGNEGNDMMSFFDEASDDGATSGAPWRDDLPKVTMEELLAEARSMSQQIKGKRPDAA